eukprot:10351988-Karenia_brevis.AAC.1
MGSSLRLCCYCSPKFGHGDVIATYLRRRLTKNEGPLHGSIAIGKMPGGIVPGSHNKLLPGALFDPATCSIPLAPNEVAVITGKKSPMCTPFRVATEGSLVRTKQQRDTLRDAFEELVNTNRSAKFIANKYGLALDKRY